MAAAPSWQVPPETLVTIEYPGVVQKGTASLDRALSTLSPNVGPTDGMPSATSALRHLARVLSLGGKLVECRLAPTDGEEGDAMQIYRHPLLGDIVSGSELVVRIQKRIWRCTHADGRTEERKEYLVTLLGGVRATVRFRRMADFAFRPDVPSGAHEHPTLALHHALVEMDVGAMQRFRFPNEAEEYEVLDTEHGKRMRSDLAMIPPPIFSRMELPFNYGLQTVSYASTAKRSRRTARKGQADTETPEPNQRILTRYLNRSRWRNMAPTALKFAEDAPAPTEPEAALAQVPLSDRHQGLLAELHKELFALVAYTFADGPWRDTLIKFGHDPRTDPESRFFQRIHLRGKTPRTPATRGVFKAEYGDVSQSARDAPSPPASEMRAATHIFDGKHSALASSTFQLCDITDISIVPLIHAEGPTNIRDMPDVATGWYTAEAWESIRAAISRQFHALLNDAPAPSTSAAEHTRLRAPWDESQDPPGSSSSEDA